jgi:3-hydroxyisobutyrate dehydrogenase-like beta-hydroxyacid dehydrogenase
MRIHLIVAASGAEVDDLRLAEERDVDGVVQVVVRDEDVRHVVRGEAQTLERVED